MTQNKFLLDLKEKNKDVQIHLMNGLKMIGKIKAFDDDVIFLQYNGNLQMIYKSNISTIATIFLKPKA